MGGWQPANPSIKNRSVWNPPKPSILNMGGWQLSKSSAMNISVCFLPAEYAEYGWVVANQIFPIEYVWVDTNLPP